MIRGSEWDRKSGAEVEEGLDGERNLLAIVELDVLHSIFLNVPPGEQRSLNGRHGSCIRRACHGIERAR